ncbi:hypothetical protein HYFRA_00013448 [Hymenoscyphus fraxineus]|uniref:Uncharacterized protein n=1 Tax=Hymenoscyphus fraxineus TaxID=746836 RepID=A0A9N9PYT0_9HELO|nr:hypothetical protein HYFRA_00013448 [Hymenoscyphus fraxineus]
MKSQDKQTKHSSKLLKMQQNTCGNCGIKGHYIELCEGPLVEGFIDACPFCNTNKHNLITCPKSLSAEHAVRLQIYCRTRRAPLIMPFDPWEVDRNVFLEMLQRGTLPLSGKLAMEIWRGMGFPMGVWKVSEGERQRDPKWDAIKNCTMKYLARQSDEWFAYLFGTQFSRPEGYLRWDQEKMKQKLGIEPAVFEIEDQNLLETDNSAPIGAEGERNQDTATAATGQAQKHTNAAVTVPANSFQQNNQQNKDESEGNKHQSKASITINIHNNHLIQAIDRVAHAADLGVDVDLLREACNIVDGAFALGIDVPVLFAEAQKRAREDSQSMENHLPSKKAKHAAETRERAETPEPQVSSQEVERLGTPSNEYPPELGRGARPISLGSPSDRGGNPPSGHITSGSDGGVHLRSPRAELQDWFHLKPQRNQDLNSSSGQDEQSARSRNLTQLEDSIAEAHQRVNDWHKENAASQDQNPTRPRDNSVKPRSTPSTQPKSNNGDAVSGSSFLQPQGKFDAGQWGGGNKSMNENAKQGQFVAHPQDKSTELRPEALLPPKNTKSNTDGGGRSHSPILPPVELNELLCNPPTQPQYNNHNHNHNTNKPRTHKPPYTPENRTLPQNHPKNNTQMSHPSSQTGFSSLVNKTNNRAPPNAPTSPKISPFDIPIGSRRPRSEQMEEELGLELRINRRDLGPSTRRRGRGGSAGLGFGQFPENGSFQGTAMKSHNMIQDSSRMEEEGDMKGIDYEQDLR